MNSWLRLHHAVIALSMYTAQLLMTTRNNNLKLTSKAMRLRIAQERLSQVEALVEHLLRTKCQLNYTKASRGQAIMVRMT